MNEALFQSLRAWRLEQARAQKVSAYVVLPDRVLRAIAMQLPVTLEALSHLNGIGLRKFEQYGQAVIELVRNTRSDEREKLLKAQHAMNAKLNLIGQPICTPSQTNQRKERVTMYIDPKSQIAKVPAMRVRDFLHRTRDAYWTCETVANRLKLSDARAQALVSELLRLGYIERSDVADGKHYHITLTGSTFALASAARPLTRKTAERKLDEFLDRVRAVNASQSFAFRIRRVLVFGSYLTDQERLNDIDIAIDMVPREDGPEKHKAANQARIRAAEQAGRQFSSFQDECMWPTKEVYLFLKSRSKAISLHPIWDAVLEQTESRVVYQEEPDAQQPRASTTKGEHD